MAVFTLAATILGGGQLVVGVVLSGYHHFFPEPTVAEKLEQIKRDVVEESPRRKVDYAENVQLHGTDAESHLLVIRGYEPRNPQLMARSDEVRIYDVADGHLNEALSFEPKPSGQRSYFFEVDTIKDLDGNSRKEVIGHFIYLSDDILAEFPVIIFWDDATGKYRITSLIPSKPVLLEKAGATYATFVRSFYQRKTVLKDRNDPNKTVASYGVDSFAVDGEAEPLGGTLVVGAFLSKGSLFDRAADLWEVRGWGFEYAGGQAASYDCKRVVSLKLRNPRDLTIKFLKAWKRKHGAACG